MTKVIAIPNLRLKGKKELKLKWHIRKQSSYSDIMDWEENSGHTQLL